MLHVHVFSCCVHVTCLLQVQHFVYGTFGVIQSGLEDWIKPLLSGIYFFNIINQLPKNGITLQANYCD